MENQGIHLAIKLVRDLEAIDTKDIEELFNKISVVPLKIKSVKDFLSTFKGDSFGHFEPGYDDNLKLKEGTIYLKNPKNDNQKASCFAALVHEYTHLLQIYYDEAFFGLKKYFSNIDDLKILNFVFSQLFADLEKTLSDCLLSKFEFLNKINEYYAQKREVNKEDILEHLSKKEIKDFIDYLSNKAISLIKQNNLISDDLLNIDKAFKDYVLIMSKMEFEAKGNTIRVFKMFSFSNDEEFFNENILRQNYAIIIDSYDF